MHRYCCQPSAISVHCTKSCIYSQNMLLKMGEFVARNMYSWFNPLNAELNPICHLLALLGAHHILHVSGLRVKRSINGLFCILLVDYSLVLMLHGLTNIKYRKHIWIECIFKLIHKKNGCIFQLIENSVPDIRLHPWFLLFPCQLCMFNAWGLMVGKY